MKQKEELLNPSLGINPFTKQSQNIMDPIQKFKMEMKEKEKENGVSEEKEMENVVSEDKALHIFDNFNPGITSFDTIFDSKQESSNPKSRFEHLFSSIPPPNQQSPLFAPLPGGFEPSQAPAVPLHYSQFSVNTASTPVQYLPTSIQNNRILN
jgi:hypothetical protein